MGAAGVSRHPNRSRIVWIGESTARGFFYEPAYTPAQAIQAALGMGAPGVQFEVIDLSSSGLQFQPLIERVYEALSYQPDAVAFLAGNNWRFGLPVDRDRLISRIRQRGPREVLALESELLSRRAQHFVQHICEHLVNTGIPALVVIPEYNLLDCGPSITATPRWLSNAGTQHWVELRGQAERALTERSTATALTITEELLQLESNCPTGVGAYLRGRALYAAGRVGDARECLRNARDYVEYPRLGSAGEHALRQACAAAGLPVIDLPLEFERADPDALPDRTRFHDHCHLTGKGIAFMARCVAESLVPILFDRDPHTISAETFEPHPELEAQAHLTAGCFVATWGQPDELVHFHFSQAAAFPRLRDAMALFADSYVHRYVPLVMSASWLRLWEESCPSLARFTKQEPREVARPMDSPIVSAAMRFSGVEQAAQLRRVAEQEHDIACVAPLDLLSDTYLKRDSAALWKGRVLHALAPTTSFVFLSNHPRPVNLSITWRRSPDVYQDRVCVSINELEVLAIDVSDHWSRCRTHIPSEAIRSGINVLTIHWPHRVILPPDIRHHLADAYESLDAGAWSRLTVGTPIPDWRPRFGHVDALRIECHA